MSFTYSGLKTAIQNYTDNTETTFVATLDNFIKTVEDRILTSVDLEYFRKNATTSMTSSNQYLAIPSDFLSSFSVSITNSSSKEFLLQKDVNFVQEFNPNSSTTGTPRYYARFDNSNFIVAPTPDANYVTEVHYYYRPTSLTAGSDSGTTWLSTNAPNALLYGCLMEAYTFMKGEQDVMAMYEKRFAESLSRLKDFGEARENADAFRRGLPDRPRT